MQFKQMFRGNSWKLAAASVVAVGLAAGGLSAAQAAGNPGIPDRSVYHIDIAKGAVGVDTIGNRSVQSYHLNKDLVSVLLAVPANGVDSSKVKDGALSEKDLDAALKAKVNQVGTGEQGPKGDPGPQGEKGAPGDPATDVKGSGAGKACEPKPIAHTGGSFKTGKTLVCSFDLPEGKWLLNASAFFARTVAGAEGVRPQLALRVGSTADSFGADYGTILGTEISATANREMTGSSVQIVDGGVTVDVYAFGYQDDTGDTDGGKITAAANLSWVRVG